MRRLHTSRDAEMFAPISSSSLSSSEETLRSRVAFSPAGGASAASGMGVSPILQTARVHSCQCEFTDVQTGGYSPCPGDQIKSSRHGSHTHRICHLCASTFLSECSRQPADFTS